MNAVRVHPSFLFLKGQINAVLVLGVILVAALLSFEVFNYSTTEFALIDLLGDVNFLGIKWATILTIAFCGIDFAGISRLFLAGRDQGEPSEAWYLFGAWMLSATMNAVLTWWGVAMVIVNHPIQSASIMDSNTITRIVPVFVALMVWLIRIMAIGTVATAGKNIFKASIRSGGSHLPSARRSSFTEEIPTAGPRSIGRSITPHVAAASRSQSTQFKRPIESEKEPSYHRFS